MLGRWFLLLYCFCPLAWAGVLQITPVKIAFAPARTIETIYITNRDAYPTVVQMDITKWKKELIWKETEGSTTDLLVTPELFSLTPGQTQLVRVALMKERVNLSPTYRLWIREVNSSQEKPANEGIRFALNLLVPITIEQTVP